MINKKALSKGAIITIIIIVIAILVGAYLLFARGGPSLSPPAECKDEVDNDGDGAVDYPKDSGCQDKYDSSEAICVVGSTSCGVGECRRTSTCVKDKSSCTPGTPSAEICGDGKDNDCNGVVDNGCDTCSDTDQTNFGGINAEVRGTVSGIKNGRPYSFTDSCVSERYLNEYYCRGTEAVNTTFDCWNNANSCNEGKCPNGEAG